MIQSIEKGFINDDANSDIDFRQAHTSIYIYIVEAKGVSNTLDSFNCVSFAYRCETIWKVNTCSSLVV